MRVAQIDVSVVAGNVSFQPGQHDRILVDVSIRNGPFDIDMVGKVELTTKEGYDTVRMTIQEAREAAMDKAVSGKWHNKPRSVK